MLIFRAKPSTTRPFCSKKEVAGRGLHKVLAENTTRRCGDFPDKPSGLGPFESHKSRTTFADKKGTVFVSLTSHHVEHWKRSKSATLVVENRKGGYLKMRDNHLMK